jgi:hypothetical protein
MGGGGVVVNVVSWVGFSRLGTRRGDGGEAAKYIGRTTTTTT